MSYDVFDHVEIRCPQLGGEVTFAYCRTLNKGLPCRRCLVCYEVKFPVEYFFRKILKEETFVEVFNAEPLSRAESFFAAVTKARQRVQSSTNKEAPNAEPPEKE